jgi:hypothetical protein
MLRTGTLHARQGYVNSTAYMIKAGVGTRFQFVITTPIHNFIEHMTFAADARPQVGVRPTCELRELGNLKVLWSGVDCPTPAVPKPVPKR